MAYYTMVTTLIAWGTLALFAIFGGILVSYAGYAVYTQIEDYIEPVKQFARSLKPTLATLKARARELAQAFVFAVEGLRPRS